MNGIALMTGRWRDRWLRCLHLFFAGMFTFVLPFICWGAEATPGHAHARAHFVFLAPMLIPTGLAIATTAELPVGAHDHSHPPHDTSRAPASVDTAPDSPVGKSTPSVLGIALLTIVGLAAFSLFLRDRPGFSVWLSSPALRLPSLLPATPPPRRSA